MRRHPNNLIRNLLIASLIILAAMHPTGSSHLAELGTGLILAIITGIANAAAANLGAAALAAGTIYIAYQAHTHRPRTRHHH